MTITIEVIADNGNAPKVIFRLNGIEELRENISRKATKTNYESGYGIFGGSGNPIYQFSRGEARVVIEENWPSIASIAIEDGAAAAVKELHRRIVSVNKKFEKEYPKRNDRAHLIVEDGEIVLG